MPLAIYHVIVWNWGKNWRFYLCWSFFFCSQVTSISRFTTPKGVFLVGKSVRLCIVGSTRQLLIWIRLSQSSDMNYTWPILDVAEILQHMSLGNGSGRSVLQYCKSPVNAVLRVSEGHGLCLGWGLTNDSHICSRKFSILSMVEVESWGWLTVVAQWCPGMCWSG